MSKSMIEKVGKDSLTLRTRMLPKELKVETYKDGPQSVVMSLWEKDVAKSFISLNKEQQIALGRHLLKTAGVSL